jgi:hypothetical protein
LPRRRLGTAHAGYNVWTGEYTFTKAELQSAVDKRFPPRCAMANWSACSFRTHAWCSTRPATA